MNLEIYGISSPIGMENLRIILPNLLPLLTGIHSLFFDMIALPTMKQCFGDKLAAIKMLEIDGKETMDEAAVTFLTDWLTSAGQDNNGPKICKVYLSNALSENITSAIQEVNFNFYIF